MLARLLNYLLNKIIWFGSKTETVTHQTHWPVSAKDAFEVCEDYAEFINVMLSDQKDAPKPHWTEGGPGKVGGQVSYLLERDGSTNIIVEQVVELNEDDATGICTLAWEQLSSEPSFRSGDTGAAGASNRCARTLRAAIWSGHGTSRSPCSSI